MVNSNEEHNQEVERVKEVDSQVDSIVPDSGGRPSRGRSGSWPGSWSKTGRRRGSAISFNVKSSCVQGFLVTKYVSIVLCCISSIANIFTNTIGDWCEEFLIGVLAQTFGNVSNRIIKSTFFHSFSSFLTSSQTTGRTKLAWVENSWSSTFQNLSRWVQLRLQSKGGRKKGKLVSFCGSLAWTVDFCSVWVNVVSDPIRDPVEKMATIYRARHVHVLFVGLLRIWALLTYTQISSCKRTWGHEVSMTTKENRGGCMKIGISAKLEVYENLELKEFNAPRA